MAAKQLDGHPGDRIGDLRTNLGMTKKELSQKTGIDASQITRIENGNLKTISSDYLIKLAKELKTSTDYILGLTPVSVPKSYDISELGLSNEAVKGLVTGTVDAEILNRLLEHKSFPRLIHLIRVYFQDTAARGIMARNQLIEMATACSHLEIVCRTTLSLIASSSCESPFDFLIVLMFSFNIMITSFLSVVTAIV